MRFTITDITRCTGGSHVIIAVTVNGVPRSFTVDAIELATLLSDTDVEGLRAAGLARLRSAVKEAGVTTPVQIRNLLVGKTFEI